MRIYHRLRTWLCRDAGAASPPAFSAWPRHTRAPGPSAGRSPYWRAGSAGSLNRIPGKNLPKYYFSQMVTNTGKPCHRYVSSYFAFFFTFYLFLFFYLPVHKSVYLSVCPHVYLSMYLSVYLYVWLPAYLSVLSVGYCICLLYIYVGLSAGLSVC